MADYSWAYADDWESAWQDLIANVGKDYGNGVVHTAADVVEASAVRRYLEPLEFDCPLHYDRPTAAGQGYKEIVAPYSGLMTWLSRGVWLPGDEPVWTDPARDAQPPSRGLTFPTPGPDTDSIFQTDVEHEFARAVVVGDRLSATGMRLVSCTPKETKVGRGAFNTWEIDVMDSDGLAVATIRATCYFYVAGAGV